MTEPRALEQFSPRERTLTQASLSDNSDSQTSFTLPIQHPEPMALSTHSKGARVNEFESIADLCKFKDPEQVFYDLTEIAQGAFGRIYAGSKRGFDGILAIKQVRLKNEVTARLTAKEIKASSDVSHFNIVKFVETYVWADQVWMIMEFVDGGTLTNVISLNSLKEGEIATICSQILQAVQCLHTSGFIHRDIKSDNVLLSRNGVVKLCDLGLCERISNNHDKLSEMAGTPHWMAPEIFESQGYGREVDIWSFGITVVEMIDGEPPHLATPWWQLGFLVKNYAAPRPRNWESTSPALQDFLTCALAVQPAERPSPNELLQHKFLQLGVEPAELGRLFQTT
ncbi:hypothetical protein FDECE_18344 [Fusarium decemcellulare]|nr:hypothetical protein FDECE_18344 [Fusarium decemcellulare]